MDQGRELASLSIYWGNSALIKADLHLHTSASHGCNTPQEMFEAALKRGLSFIGFSEHSPRPEGYDYTHEYREHLAKVYPEYIRQVVALKSQPEKCQVLLGMEMDWLSGQEEFIRSACHAYDYDYIIGSVHFIEDWGFDDRRDAWQDASQEICEKRYEAYFKIWKEMLMSGLFQIAAHPDLIKIYSRDQFHLWLSKPEAQGQIRDCLIALRDSGMAMEISSAGLRKDCREFYPAPAIMQMASELGLSVSMASDAHCVNDVGRDFGELERYASSFGFKSQTVFDHGRASIFPIC